MNVYLLRHGIAVEPGTGGYTKDSDRPLTPKGKRKVRKIAEAMLELDLSFDLVLSSPYVRARETAQIVATSLKCQRRLEFTEVLAPSASPAQCAELLSRLDPPLGDVLLIGHEPYLAQLMSLLISGGGGVSILLKKGGLCKLAAKSIKPGRCAQLEWLLTPKQLLKVRG